MRVALIMMVFCSFTTVAVAQVQDSAVCTAIKNNSFPALLAALKTDPNPNQVCEETKKNSASYGGTITWSYSATAFAMSFKADSDIVKALIEAGADADFSENLITENFSICHAHRACYGTTKISRAGTNFALAVDETNDIAVQAFVDQGYKIFKNVSGNQKVNFNWGRFLGQNFYDGNASLATEKRLLNIINNYLIAGADPYSYDGTTSVDASLLGNVLSDMRFSINSKIVAIKNWNFLDHHEVNTPAQYLKEAIYYMPQWHLSEDQLIALLEAFMTKNMDVNQGNGMLLQNAKRWDLKRLESKLLNYGAQP